MTARSGPLVAAALAAAFLAVVSLVLPWFVIVGKARSSIDLISSASALDVIEGGMKLLVITGWLIAPVLVSASMLIAASGRHRLAAAFVLPISLAFIAVFLVGLVVDEIGIAWGAIFGGVCAVVAAVFAMMVFVKSSGNPRSTAEAVA